MFTSIHVAAFGRAVLIVVFAGTALSAFSAAASAKGGGFRFSPKVSVGGPKISFEHGLKISLSGPRISLGKISNKRISYGGPTVSLGAPRISLRNGLRVSAGVPKVSFGKVAGQRLAIGAPRLSFGTPNLSRHTIVRGTGRRPSRVAMR